MAAPADESTLAREAAETAAGATRQLAAWPARLAELVTRLRAHPPPLVVTCARGSSDHAASYGKYLIETMLGRPVASLGPSVTSIYGRALAGLEGALCVVVSQSGRSPDLLTQTAAARRAGAFVVGMINDVGSPLAASCDLVLPLCAGPERAIAATKSFLLAGLGWLQLVAAWADDPALRDAADRAPMAFAAAAGLDWGPGLTPLATASSVYVVGRGIGLGAARELALKLKETCRLHAEAFSTAELMHGPLALVGPGFPILALGQDDATAAQLHATVAHLGTLGATVISTSGGTHTVPTVAEVPAVLAPLCAVQSCYLALPQLAASRGVDADAPPHLTKITRTE